MKYSTLSRFGALALAINLNLSAAEHHLGVSDFGSAEQCAVCHGEIYRQWQTSMHSQAATDSVFLQMLPQAERDLQVEGRTVAYCLGCHAPVATVSKEITISAPVSFPLKLGSVAREGVTCDYCHTISGNEDFGKDISVGIYRYPRKGDTAIKYGVHDDVRTTNHLISVSKFLQSAEFCGICHKFDHLQNTYEEWKNGPYAKSAKNGGKRCQDCHMPRFNGQAAEGAPERNDLHAHVFLGGHSEMVKKVATVTLLALPNATAGKRQVNLKVVVKNVGSGHLMPTGLPGMRQMWLEAVVQDAQGNVVFTNGLPIGIEMLGPDGKPTMPWNPGKLGKDTRIGPQETLQTSRTPAWVFRLPETDVGRLEAKVSVYYRSISELAARAAGIPPSEAIEIASDRLWIFPDGAVKRPPLN